MCRRKDGGGVVELVIVEIENDSAVPVALIGTFGEWVVRGDATEAAFLVAERKLGTDEGRAARRL